MSSHHHDGRRRAEPVAMRAVEVVAPNFKRRLSGVTSTIVQLVPLQARSMGIATLGPGLPDDLPKIRWWQVSGLLRPPINRPFRVWHARRNLEMLGGLALKHVFRAPLRLLFTSAAQRHHRPFTKWLIRNMDLVVATNSRSGSFLEVPYRVVMHGVDTERFHPPRGAEDEWRASGLPGRYGIGCFGRLRHQKGTDLFVDAMIALLPRYPDWTAVVTGLVTAENREYAAALKRRVKEAGLSGRIHFLGEVPDVRVWYRRVLLYVAPSRNEGFGLTPLEAMASGTAVVASDAGAYAEMIVPDRTGAVVPAGDGEALKEAIGRYLADPERAAAHGRQALEHVQAHFPLEGEARALGEIYEDLFRGAGR